MSFSKFLFVFGGSNEWIGGHYISGITLARELAKKGHKVGVLIHPQKYAIPEMDTDMLCWHYYSYPKNRVYAFFIRRPVDIYKTIEQYGYEYIVACDHYSIFQSWLSILVKGIPIIQIRAGGVLPYMAMLRLPGIIVFSEELYHSLIEKYKIPSDYIRISQGRVDFNYFTQSNPNLLPELGFHGESKKILCVSRLVKEKAPAIKALFEEILHTSNGKNIQLVIVGDGDAKEDLVQQARKVTKIVNSRARIWFVGAFRVTPNVLRQADLVVGQGRTVVEAIASGVPAAVSGSEGYFSLITSRTYFELAGSNFTGRGIAWRGSLSEDLESLEEFSRLDFQSVYELARRDYDVTLGSLAIESAAADLQDKFPTPGSVSKNYLRAYLIHIVDRIRSKTT